MKREDIADVVLGKSEGIKFVVNFHGVNLRYSIKYLEAGQVLEIMGKLEDIIKVDEDAPMLQELIKRPDDIRRVIEAITIATGSPFRSFTRKVISSLPFKDLETLWSIVYDRMDINRFFFILISIKGQMKEILARTQTVES